VIKKHNFYNFLLFRITISVKKILKGRERRERKKDLGDISKL